MAAAATAATALRTLRMDADVEAGDPDAEARAAAGASPLPLLVDKAVSTGDLGAPLGDLLAALVQTKASAIKAECERDRRKAWRLHWLRRKEPAQARVTPMVHHNHTGHHHPLHHHHHHHHHNHRHHHHHHGRHQPPITLHGSPLSPDVPAASMHPLGSGVDLSACSSDVAACTLPAPHDLTVTGMCTTSDAPGLPSDTALSAPADDSDSAASADLGLPPLPLDPPPSRPRPRRPQQSLRRTLSSRSHQYHNYDYTATRVTSWSCSATPLGTPAATPAGTPAGTPVGTPVGTPLEGTPAGSAAPSRAPTPPTPLSPEDPLRLLYLSAGHPVDAVRPAPPAQDRPRRKKRRRRKAGPGVRAAKGAKPGAKPGAGAAKKARARAAGLPPPEPVRPVDPDELPKRARLTIAFTACILLFLCMLLVGLTLRMAPIIDEMVRKQNEEHMSKLNRTFPLNLTGDGHGS